MNNKNLYDIKELGFIPPIYGGVSVSIARLIDKLTSDGFIVGGFYTKDNNDIKVLESSLFDLELNMSTKRFLFRLPRCLKVLAPYKILHSHYSLGCMIYLWSFLHFLHKKIVITVHNSMVQSYYSNCGLINRFFLKKIANHKDVTWIAVSEQAKEKMLSLPVSFNLPIHVIPAYIPNTRIDSEPLSETLSRYLHNHQKVITFYGHSFMIHNGNDVYGFRDAFTLFQSLTKRYEAQMGFVLCLSDSNEKKKIADLHLLAKSFGIDELIFWQIGAINNMNALWAHTDVYIRPTSTDGDSVAIREALDMGVQVVASDVCMRPQRSITYEYGNNDDFLRKVLFALEEGHIQPSPDYSNYDKIKAIYTKLL